MATVEVDIDQFDVEEITQYLSVLFEKGGRKGEVGYYANQRAQIVAWIKSLSITPLDIKSVSSIGLPEAMRDEFYELNKNKITLEMLERLVK